MSDGESKRKEAVDGRWPPRHAELVKYGRSIGQFIDGRDLYLLNDRVFVVNKKWEVEEL